MPSWYPEFYGRVHSGMIAVHTGFAMAILIGSSIRFQLDQTVALLQITDGRMWPWGLWIGVSGILMAVRSRTLDAVGLLTACLWMNLWMAGFFVAIRTAPNPTLIAMIGVALGGYGAVNAILFAAKVEEWRKTRAVHKRAG